MLWQLSNRFDPECLNLADRHYNRQKVGSPQFVPPGRCLVLKHKIGGVVQAVWVSSWPEFARHQWKGAWVNTLFRKECGGIASEFILEAVARTVGRWPKVPNLGMITFIDPSKVPAIIVRGKPKWGYSYEKAGFNLVGKTGSELLAFQLLPQNMPAPISQDQVSGQRSFEFCV